jgi:hypothetical protein
VPDAPLPEGVQFEVQLIGSPEMPAELRDEIEAWSKASDRALKLAEEATFEDDANAAR